MFTFQRLLAFALVVITTLAPGQRGQAAADDNGGIIRLGAWNIQFLGSRTPAQKAEDLARYIKFAKVDILALEEITPTGPAPAGFAAPFESSIILDEICSKLTKLQDGKWRHVLFPAFFLDAEKGKQQWVGVAWNESKVEPRGQPFKIPVSNAIFGTGKLKENLWKRNAHAMHFSAGKEKTDFILIPVHMKSNAGPGDFRPHRAAEAKELIDQLPALDKAFPKERDIVILGDMNFLQDEKDDDGEVRQEKARELLKQAGFKDLNANNEDTHLGGGQAPFDRFFVPGDQPEFTQAGQIILRDFLKQEMLTQKAFINGFSDHLMIVTEIQVTQDDD